LPSTGATRPERNGAGNAGSLASVGHGFGRADQSKKVSAKEAATAALARLDAVNPKINAVVDHKPAEVLAEAAAIDAQIARGEDPACWPACP
jgi:Asp-tRNA(Asn)/Glu-tRNA(Gln) amidotransferase A subunit family amidase